MVRSMLNRNGVHERSNAAIELSSNLLRLDHEDSVAGFEHEKRQKNRASMKVSIVIPCYNECSTIAKIVAAVRGAPNGDKENILGGDGSTHGTAQLLAGGFASLVDQMIFYPIKPRKGGGRRSRFFPPTGGIFL